MFSWLTRSSKKEQKTTSGPFQVIPGVSLSSVVPALDRDTLRLAGITHILNLTGPISPSDPSPRYPNQFPSEFTYMHICLPDEVDQLIRPYFERTHAFIDSGLKSGGRVLLHCEAGISRSPAFLASYLMRRKGLVLRQALAVIKAAKPDIGPNAGFFGQLYNYEMDLVKMKVLPQSEVPSIGLKEYLMGQLLEGPCSGMERTVVEATLVANHLDPNRTLEMDSQQSVAIPVPEGSSDETSSLLPSHTIDPGVDPLHPPSVRGYSTAKEMEATILEDLGLFSIPEEILEEKPRKVREFYREQNATIASSLVASAHASSYLSRLRAVGGAARKPSLSSIPKLGSIGESPPKPVAKRAEIAISASFFVNVGLLAIKLLVLFASGSTAVLANAVESVLDLFAGSLIYVSSRLAATPNKTHYPTGRHRLEPLSIIVLAVLSSMAALQVANGAADTLLEDQPSIVDMDTRSIVLMSLVVVIKTGLWKYCAMVTESPGAQALAQDHFNDVISNIFTLLAAVAASKGYWWIDPLAALLISLYIVVNWVRYGHGLVPPCVPQLIRSPSTTFEQIKTLTGPAASAHELRVLTHLVYSFLTKYPTSRYVLANPDSARWADELKKWYVDTVRAYHMGNHLFVECDVVLPEDMPLRIAHE
ncbi:hypothetical protein HDU93_006520 [Gonapodya sp. JEL0774]|nr:hypothetical protein HDU93_006520 [Gonapodya sp. JEL0774]